MFTVITLPEPPDNTPPHPVARLAVEAGGVRLASGVLHAGSPVGAETGQLLDVRWAAGRAEAARAVIAEALRRARPGGEVHLSANTEVHEWLDERLALAASCGFQLYQEKEGIWWADAGQRLPEPEGVRVRTLTDVGRARYIDVIAACTPGTLDRVDRDAVAQLGARGWAAAFVADCATPEDDDTWYLIEDDRGDALGFVAVGAFDEERVGTIMHIGVVAGHRGHGHVDQLFRLANRAARERGWRGMLSDVDVLNRPMLAAAARHDHRADGRPWHKWIFRTIAPGNVAPGNIAPVGE